MCWPHEAILRTFIHGYIFPTQGDADEDIDGNIIKICITIDTGDTYDLLPCPLGLIYGEYDRLGVIASGVSIDDDVGAVGE